MSVKTNLLRFELGVTIGGKIDSDMYIITNNKTNYTKKMIHQYYIHLSS
jgi:hypothetical protein